MRRLAHKNNFPASMIPLRQGQLQIMWSLNNTRHESHKPLNPIAHQSATRIKLK